MAASTVRLLSATTILGLLALQASADLFINEIYFDPPGGGDSINEYIELRGVPGMSLENHYLVFLENEISNAGNVDNIFDLGAFSLGSNGFLTLRQKGNEYGSEQVQPGAVHLINDGPGLPPFGTSPGFGSGAASTIGAADSNGEGKIENGAFSALLIHNVSGAAPVVEEDLDLGNDGLDVPTGKAGWEILDSIAIAEEDETLTARSYAAITFASNPLGGLPGDFEPLIEPGSEFVVLPYEIEYVGRWGNSVGQSEADWHVTNLTDNNGSGFVSGGDFRVAGAHPLSDGNPNTPAPQPDVIETNRGVPYGTKITNTLGSPNFLTGDFNKDGIVDAADYTVWRDTESETGTESNHPAADPNHDFLVDDADYALWTDFYGGPNASPRPSESVATPEPGTAALVMLGVLAITPRGVRR